LSLVGCDGKTASLAANSDAGVAASDAQASVGTPDAGEQPAPRAIAVSDVRTMEVFGFSPMEANPEAVSWYGVQQVARFRREREGEPLPVRGKLVVILNGVGGPAGPNEVGDWLADRGFHTLTLDYRNTESVRLFEDSVPGDGLAGPIEAYKEIVEGVDASRDIVVPPADSVFGRIDSALQYLSTLDPGADWGYYLDSDGHARLLDVYFFGYSFGAGTSTVIGKSHPVGRVVTASGPRYVLDVNHDWLATPSVTPVDRFFGIFGVQDPDFPDFVATTELLGWPGEVIDTTIVPPPYEHSHRLQTNQGHLPMCSGTELDDVCEYAFGIQ
jgi:hypothetical protein